MSSPLQNNITNLQSVLDAVNALPEEVTLPELTNPGDASKALSGYEFINGDGEKITGTMPNNGDVSATMDGINTKSVTIAEGYTTGGSVSLDSTIDNAVSAALNALTDKGVEVPDGTNVTGLAELINAIESGSGKWWYQTYIPAEDVSSVLLRHELDAIPAVAGLFCINFDTSSATVKYLCDCVIALPFSDGSNAFGMYRYKNQNTTYVTKGVTENYSTYPPVNNSLARPMYVSAAALKIQDYYNENTTGAKWYLQAGKTYVFFAGVVE